MTLHHKTDSWLIRFLRNKSDTPETISQKVYLVRNMIVPMIGISLCLMLILFLKLFQLFLIISALIWYMLLTVALLKIVKKGVTWILFFYYSGYIVMCCIITLMAGGLPNSAGVWGGSVICFLLVLGLKNKRFLVANALIYFICLLVIGFSFPFLTPHQQITPKLNNIFFTFNELWMCLYLVKAFYDSIVARTKEAQQKVRHIEQLDQLKSKLYANIAHEFRTPLTLIKGNAEEIGEHYSHVSQQTSRIIQHSNKVLFLVNQLLNLSKIEEGGVAMHYLQSDLVAFVQFVVGSFQGFADARQIKLQYRSQLASLMMDLDTEKLEESLSNLISNAIKYTPAGGKVDVTLRMPGPLKAEQPQVEISVRDTGIGIPENQLEKIFIRFYRIEDNRYPYQEGTGIGLTLVKEYLKMMKGSISVKSSPGEGSEFIMKLPVTQNAPKEAMVPKENRYQEIKVQGVMGYRSHGSEASPPQLLIIEDNNEMSEYLAGLLGEAYQITTAVNGDQGIEKAIEHVPDIILSDVMIPGKDGFQVCAILKNDFRTNHIPIVLLTARTDIDSRIMGLKAGADAYLNKPFDRKELMVCLHNLFVQRETLRLKFSTDTPGASIDEKQQGLNERFLSQIISHLEINSANEKYGIHDLHVDMGISRVQLHRKLRALTGQSSSQFIRNFRLQKARNLLLKTDKEVTDIAYEVGFADANYFTKAFVREYGLSASQMRKSFRLAFGTILLTLIQ